MMTLAATQVSVIFSLNIMVRDDRRGNSLLPVPILPVPIFVFTSFFFMLWRVWRVVKIVRLEIEVLGISMVQAMDIFCKVVSIGFNSIKFGLA